MEINNLIFNKERKIVEMHIKMKVNYFISTDIVKKMSKGMKMNCIT